MQNKDQANIPPSLRILSLLEPALITVISFAIISMIIALSISYLMSLLGYLELAKNVYSPIVKLIKLMHGNWKSLMVILVPLFYQEIKFLVSRVEKWGNLEFQKSAPYPISANEDMKKILAEEE